MTETVADDRTFGRWASLEGAHAHPAPHAYRTFSPKLAPALTAAGGMAVILAGLGTWIRVAQAVSPRSPLEETGATMGYESPGGWAIAGLGLLMVVASATWFLVGWKPKLVPVLGALIVGSVAAWRLPAWDRQVQAMVVEAQERLGFAEYHAHFGWGSWSLAIGAVLLFVGAAVGVMREADVRRGFSDET